MSIVNINNELTRLQSATNQVRFEQGRDNLGSSELDRDAFLQLMLAQLQYQNPIEPVDNTEQLMQQAQFTQVEELQKLNQNLSQSNELTQASSLVGKQVEFTDENGLPQSGLVESVLIGNGSVGLEVNGQVVSTEQVTKIFASN